MSIVIRGEDPPIGFPGWLTAAEEAGGKIFELPSSKQDCEWARNSPVSALQASLQAALQIGMLGGGYWVLLEKSQVTLFETS